jgi:hypothetical protein
MLPIVEVPEKIKYSLSERKTSETKSGKEWCLHMQFLGWEGRGGWCMQTWEKKPTEAMVEDAKYLILRSMEVYHRHLVMPFFKVKEEK